MDVVCDEIMVFCLFSLLGKKWFPTHIIKNPGNFTDIAPQNRLPQRERLVFQLSFFRGYVEFPWCIYIHTYYIYIYISHYYTLYKHPHISGIHFMEPLIPQSFSKNRSTHIFSDRYRSNPSDPSGGMWESVHVRSRFQRFQRFRRFLRWSIGRIFVQEWKTNFIKTPMRWLVEIRKRLVGLVPGEVFVENEVVSKRISRIKNKCFILSQTD